MKIMLTNNKLKNTLLASTVLALTTGLSACVNDNKPSAASKDAKQLNGSSQERLNSVEQDVEALLAKMTLPEKVSLAHGSIFNYNWYYIFTAI